MYCKKCGTELLPDAGFCENCGAPADAAFLPPDSAQIPAYGQPMPLHKKNNIKITPIVLAVVFLSAAALAILWFAGVIGAERIGGEETETLTAQTQQNAEKSELQNTLEPSKEGNPVMGDSPGVDEASMQLLATGKPTAMDFEWFTDRAERWVFGITPADALMMEDFYALLGSWKGLQMIFDYDKTVLEYTYFTATFDDSGPNVAALLDWQYLERADGSQEELTDREDESLTGSFAAPMLSLGEAGNRIELILYSRDGKQYAEGKWIVQSGEEIRMALVRP